MDAASRREPGAHRAPARREPVQRVIKRIGVIGAGQMGSGIAHVCALEGFDVAPHRRRRRRQLDKAPRHHRAATWTARSRAA